MADQVMTRGERRLPVLSIVLLAILAYATISAVGAAAVGALYLATEGPCARCNLIEAWPKMNVPAAVSVSLIGAALYGGLLLAFGFMYRRRWRFTLFVFGVVAAVFACLVVANIGYRAMSDKSLFAAAGVWAAMAIAGIAIGVVFRPRKAPARAQI